MDDSDTLRTPLTVCQPDSRSPTTSFLTNEPLTIEHQHSAVSELVLHKGVPGDIRVQFETTKNLYLYAWFVYRFYPVAKHHAYTCLEFALRERFEPELLAAGEKKREFGPGLKRLLSYAVKSGVLKDENFSVWQHRTERRAQRRTEDEIWEEAKRNGLNEVTFDDTQYEIKDVDRDHEYLETVIKTTPWLRNVYAHGSSSLDNQALGTIGVFQDRCRVNHLYAASRTGRSGFNWTAPTGSQLRLPPTRAVIPGILVGPCEGLACQRSEEA